MTDEHLISLQPGTVIAGRYEVVKCLGAGSMGLVYACRHRELAGHLVAIKVLFPEVAQDSVASARFRNEIVASYGVSHPNVVRAYEYFRDGDLVAYTMEFIGGGDLADRLGHSSEKISIQEIVKYLSQITSGVQAIHDAGIVHRDLKPENILLTEANDVKITDFGIARTGHGPKLTEHGGVVGTIDYVSPEYLEKGQVDSRSDIYAIGVLGYEMITGDSPFRGDSVIATMTMRLRSDPKPPSALRSDCPKELDAIILKAMARDPDTRYQKGIEMYYDLQPLMEEFGLIPRAHGGKNSVATAAVTSSQSQLSPDNGNFVTRPNNSPDSGATPSVMDTQKGVNFFIVERNENKGSLGSGRLGSMANMTRDRANSAPKNFFEEAEGGDTIQEPLRMESVLSYSDIGTRGTAVFEPPKRVSLGADAIDNKRIRSLSESVAYSDRPLWLDLVTLIVAVFIGLGVGLAVVRMVKPEIFYFKSQKESEIRILDDQFN